MTVEELKVAIRQAEKQVGMAVKNLAEISGVPASCIEVIVYSSGGIGGADQFHVEVTVHVKEA